MLRSLTPREPELVRMCHDKAWASVALRAESHPEEACPSASALKGQGTTALAIAVRSGAPPDIIQAIVKANVHQIGIHHERRGSIIQEALKHRCTHDVLRYLLQSLIHYENVHSRSASDVQPNLLGRRDDLGRTALHYIVEHTLRDMTESRQTINWILFRSLVLACPEAVGMMDSDGNTPLALLLLTPRLGNADHEAKLFRMVQLLVISCPSAATITKRLNQPWKRPHNEECPNNNCVTVGDGAPNPVACALLYGRKLDTIELLLDANQKVGVKACRAIISRYHEVPLHIAVAMRASPSMLSKLLEHGCEALSVSDIHGLTPLDWAWIRFVVDWCSSQHPLAHVMVSKRRYVSNQFLEWHRRVSQQLGDPSSLDPLGTFLREQLWERVSILLPAAAAIQAKEGTGEWDVLHAACFVNCPMALVNLALKCSPSQVSKRDAHSGRLPLHYAAGRFGFSAQVPMGVPHRLERVSEGSPVELVLNYFTKATHVCDDNYQLPLHVAIESAKLLREAAHCSVQDENTVHTLLRHYHDALERRDGKTKLYPFLQAAAGEGACTSTIYALLREHPTLVVLGIPHC